MTQIYLQVQASEIRERDLREGKMEEDTTELPQQPVPNSTPTFPFMNSSSTARDVGFERIQYLSRNHYHHPGPPDALLGNDSPDTAIQKVVSGQWENYIRRHPLVVRPAFSASPQSFYLGRTTRSDGQVVHDFVNLNSIQVLYNSEDGRPFTLTGHLYSHLIQSPAATSVVWPLEVPYPADERIQSAMSSFTPLDDRNLHVPEDASRPTHEESNVSPTDDDAVAHSVSTPYCDDPAIYQVPQTSTPPSTTRSKDHQIQSTASAVTERKPSARHIGYSVIFGEAVSDSSESDPGSPPPLQYVSDSSGSDAFEYVPVDPCESCKGPPHRVFHDCPVWRLPSYSADETGLGTIYYMDDIISPEMLTKLLEEGEIDEFEPTHLGSTQPQDAPGLAFSAPDNTPVPAQPVPLPDVPPATASTMVPSEDLVMQNLRQILGLTTDQSKNIARMRDLARMAEAQAHTAFETLSAQLETMRSEEAVAETECVDQPRMSTMMTEAILTHRKSFSLTMGLQSRSSSSSVESDECQDERVEKDAASVADPLRFGTPGSVLGPMGDSGSQIVTDHGDSLAFAPLAVPSLSTETPNYSPIAPSYSPAVPAILSPQTDRSVESDNDYVDPQAVIDDAVGRIISGAPPKRLVYPESPPASPPASLSSEPSPTTSPHDDADSEVSNADTAEFLAAIVDVTGFPPIFQFNDGTDNTVGNELVLWTERQMERATYTRKWEVDFAAESLKTAYNAAYGPLCPYLDFPLMAANNFRELSKHVQQYRALTRTLPPDYAGPHLVAADAALDQPQSTVAMDLPRQSPAEQVPSSSAPVADHVDKTSAEDDDHVGKRKGTDSGISTDEHPRKRFRKFRGDSLRRHTLNAEAFKAAHLREPRVLGALALVRRELLSGIERVQDILVRERADFRAARERYFEENEWIIEYREDDPKFSGSRRLNHPLLFDVEAAKLQIIYILLYQRGLFELAALVDKLLALRFRDSYPIALLLTGGFLDYYAYPNDDSDFWDSLGSSSHDGSADMDLELGYPEESAPIAVTVDHPNPAHDDSMDGEDGHCAKRTAYSVDDAPARAPAGSDAQAEDYDIAAPRPFSPVASSLLFGGVSQSEMVVA
ncbi:hypothetical protein B0H11DRAFT_1916670 [Mycena galericulata]|nr:hypothetical protein B0H11DRAFT_1916670 [Mycena galericulata]